MGKLTRSGELVKIQLGKTPDMPSQTMARMLRNKYPTVFSSISMARCRIKYYRGANGKKDIKSLTDRRFVLPKTTKENPLSLPESMSDELQPYILSDALKRIGIMGDIHFPYHDINALTIAIHELQSRKIDALVLNGDIMDCYSLSRFEKRPDKRNFPKERELTVHGLMAIRQAFPGIPIIYKCGNHEERFRHHLTTNASDFYGLSEMRLEVLLDLFNLGIEWVADKRIIRYRSLDIIHGHEMASTTGGVNPARTALLKLKTCCIVNHFHRKSNDVQRTSRDEYLQSWSVACLCEKSPLYMPINEWIWGFACIHGGNNWTVENRGIIGNMVV